MSIQKKELYNIIEDLPDELSDKVIDYVKYLKFIYAMSKAPTNVLIKDKNDLVKKIEEGINDTNNGKVHSIEDTFIEVNKILEN